MRLSLDLLLKKIHEAQELKINAITLFPVIEDQYKSESAHEAFREDGLVQNTIRAIKKEFPDMGVITVKFSGSSQANGTPAAICIPSAANFDPLCIFGSLV